MALDTVSHILLMQLFDAGTIRGADVVGHPGGWSLIIKFGAAEKQLIARSGEIRIFNRFETVVKFLSSINIHQFNVNSSNYQPAKRNSRPDTSARMKKMLLAGKKQ